MATAAEGSLQSVPISADEATKILVAVNDALAEIGSYKTSIIAPVEEESADYATLYIYKLSESEE